LSHLKFVSVLPLSYHRKVHTKVNTFGTEIFKFFKCKVSFCHHLVSVVGHLSFCQLFILLTPWNTQWRSAKNETLRQEMISIFPLSTFNIFVATFQQHLNMGYISLRWSDIPELVVPIRISLIEGCCYQESHWTKGSY